MLLASLYMCGRHGDFDPAATRAETLEGPAYPFKSCGKLRRHGASFPYWFTQANNHVGRYPGLTLDDAPKLAAMYSKLILDAARGLPQDYAQFQKDMRQAVKAAPWNKVK